MNHTPTSFSLLFAAIYFPFEHKVDGMDVSHNLLGTSGKDCEYFSMAFEGGCWFVYLEEAIFPL